VGFGKTEVAIRAIFKAVTAGKLLAILTPTTILTQQHYHTLKERFAPCPVNIVTIWIDAHLSPAIATWITTTFGITGFALRDIDLRDAEDPEIFER